MLVHEEVVARPSAVKEFVLQQGAHRHEGPRLCHFVVFAHWKALRDSSA